MGTAVAAATLAATAVPVAAAGVGGFTDVAAGNPHVGAIVWMVEEGITEGCDGSAFCPGDWVSRGQLATFLQRFAESGVVDAGTVQGMSAEELRGQRGPSGHVGATGPIGPAGLEGAVGVQGEPGPPGEPGATGPRGDSGPQGETGATGPQGATGTTGPQGDVGPQGATGATGPQGDVGPQGATGATGPPGEQGIQGPKGADGVSGHSISTAIAAGGGGGTTSGRATCAPGKVVVGGGYIGPPEGSPDYHVWNVTSNGPDSPSSWLFTARDTGFGDPGLPSFTVYAICVTTSG